MSDEYIIRDRFGLLVYSLLTGKPMRLSKSLADETRADLDFEDRGGAPHRVEVARDELTVDDH